MVLMLTLWALVLIAAGFVMIRRTWLGFVPAIVGALIIPLPSWWIAAVHFVAH
jgi:hypothetical protein